MAELLLDIRGLKTWFKTDDGMVRAVDGIDLHIDRGEQNGGYGRDGRNCKPTDENIAYLRAKQRKLGHLLGFDPDSDPQDDAQLGGG